MDKQIDHLMVIYHDRNYYGVTSEGIHQFDVPASFSINEWNIACYL